MPDDDTFFLQPSQEPLNQELRGLVIDEDQIVKNRLWNRLCIAFVMIVAIISWSYLFLAKSEEEQLQLRLRDHQEIKRMIVEAQDQINRTQITQESLQKATELAIQAAHTPLRKGEHPTAPYIDERNEAILTALEGLLKLSLQSSYDPDIGRYITFSLYELGTLPLQYTENGLRKSRPLMQEAEIRQRISQQSRLTNSQTDPRLLDLRQQLQEVREEESSTIATAALNLGKWYRSRGETDRALRSFHISRKYIEGEYSNKQTLPGHPPQELTALWDQYCQALEALAEDAFQRGKFRAARAYLRRIYRTPKGLSTVENRFTASSAHNLSTREIGAVQQDLRRLEEAIEAPLRLPSYPFFTSASSDVNWQKFAASLRNARRKPGRSVAKIIWEGLSSPLQQTLLEEDLPKLDERQIAELQADLNQLLTDRSLSQRAAFTTESLSPRAKKLHEELEERALSSTETAFLNRELIEQAALDACSLDYQLSDGSRLHNALSKSAKAHFLFLLQEERNAGVEGLEETISALYQENWTPTIQDLYRALGTQKERLNASQKNLEKQAMAVLQELNELDKMISAQESSQQLNLNTILELQKQQQRLETRLRHTRVEQKLIAQQEEENQADQALLVEPLKKRLEETEELLTKLKRQGPFGPTYLDEQPEPELEQVEALLDLHLQYLTLLQKLKQTAGMNEIALLKGNLEQLETTLVSTREKMRSAAGDRREEIQRALLELEQKRDKTLEAFNTIFSPLKTIVEEIAQAEEEVWENGRLLRDARKQIVKIIGEQKRPGTLLSKIKRRQQLILQRSEGVAAAPLYDAEIARLNEEIAKDHEELHHRLAIEESAQKRLITIYPHLLAEQEGNSVSAVSLLRDYLNKQEQHTERYRLVRHQAKLQKQIKCIEQDIITSLNTISEVVDEFTLTAQNTMALSRAIATIHSSRQEASRLKERLAESIQSQALLKSSDEAIFQGRGFLLEATELFALEHQLGINLRRFHRYFEEREALIEELSLLTDERAKLEERQQRALRQRDQRTIDQLIPLIAGREKQILHHTERVRELNQQLRAEAALYGEEQTVVQNFRQRLLPVAEEVEDSLASIDHQLSEHYNNLSAIIQDIVDVGDLLQKSTQELQLNDLYGIDNLIAEQERTVSRLRSATKQILKKNYYQAKATWLTGKSYFEESRLTDFGELASAEEVPLDTLKGEELYGAILGAEYSKANVFNSRFQLSKEEKDRNRTETAVWVTFLEEQAIDLLQERFPVYLKNNQENCHDLEAGLCRQITDYYLYSLDTLARLHMHRALRDIRNSSSSVAENKQAQVHFYEAERAFKTLLDVFKLYAGEKLKTAQIFNAPRMGDAFASMGIISMLRGDQLTAIDYFRTLLADLSDSEDREPLFNEKQQPFQPPLHPYYASLLSRYPRAAEIIYRQGRCYHLLAEEELEQSLLEQTPPSKESETRAERYLRQATALYTQVTEAEHYSLYRTPALLYRSRALRSLKEYEAARSDLITLLGTHKDEGGSWTHVEMNSKGDLPGELYPGYAFIAFELGQLYLEQNLFTEASDALVEAKKYTLEPQKLIEAKIAYAQALKASGQYTLAYYFYDELLGEQSEAEQHHKHLYPPELTLELAQLQHELGQYSSSQQTLRTLVSLAPAELRSGSDLDLSRKWGMTLLKSDYRDAIRPLAEMYLQLGRTAALQLQFDLARYHFSQAHTLYALIPWREDRLLQKKSWPDYRSWVDGHLITTEWLELHIDVVELLTRLGEPMRQIESASDIEKTEEILSYTQETIHHQQKEIQPLIERVDAFYQHVRQQIPTEDKRAHITPEIRLLQQGVDNIWALLEEEKTALPRLLIKQLYTTFAEGSFERQLLDEFSKELLKEKLPNAPYTEIGLQTVASLKHETQLLASVREELEKKLEDLRRTHLTSSTQIESVTASIAEEAALHLTSLLSLDEERESYYRLTEIADFYLNKLAEEPWYIQDRSRIWEMGKIAAIQAIQRKDWRQAEPLLIALLTPGHIPDFVKKNRDDLKPLQLFLARSFLEQADIIIDSLVYEFDEMKQNKRQNEALQKRQQAKYLLQELVNMEGQGAQTISCRTLAKKLLTTI